MDRGLQAFTARRRWRRFVFGQRAPPLSRSARGLRARHALARLATDPARTLLSHACRLARVGEQWSDELVPRPISFAMFEPIRIADRFVAHPRHSPSYGCGSLRALVARTRLSACTRTYGARYALLMSPLILGISAYYHDSAACVIRNGAILAAAQEERFKRKKQ